MILLLLYVNLVFTVTNAQLTRGRGSGGEAKTGQHLLLGRTALRAEVHQQRDVRLDARHLDDEVDTPAARAVEIPHDLLQFVLEQITLLPRSLATT